jgi:tRNA pseudouridine65 synthase
LEPLLEPESIRSLPVLYLDDDVVVVDKPAGLLVHPSDLARDRITVLSIVRDQLGKYLYPVHRLDRGTSGCLVFALTKEAAREIHEALEFDVTLQSAAESTERASAAKTYLALVRGVFSGPAELTHAIPKGEGLERVTATTCLDLVESLGWASLVRAQPKTGRYHQVRRHLAHLRFPIANDSNYGTGWFNRKVRADLGLLRLGLHAARISIPRADGPDLIAESPLPADFEEALRRLRTN